MLSSMFIISFFSFHNKGNCDVTIGLYYEYFYTSLNVKYTFLIVQLYLLEFESHTA